MKKHFSDFSAWPNVKKYLPPTFNNYSSCVILGDNNFIQAFVITNN